MLTATTPSPDGAVWLRCSGLQGDPMTELMARPELVAPLIDPTVRPTRRRTSRRTR